MANPRIPSDYWDDSEQEELHYPNATRRRVAFAHALGVVGVLGTFTLAAFAFAPRMPFISAKVHSLLSKDQPALRSAEPITQVAVTNSPAPSVTVAQPAPVPPAPDVTATEPSTASVAAIAPASAVATAPEPAATAPAVATAPPPVVATAPAPVVATAPAPAIAVPPEPAAAPAREPVAAPSAPASAPDTASGKGAKSAPESKKLGSRALAASTVRTAPRSEPRLTAREIERRKERYEAWLKQEGLEPVR